MASYTIRLNDYLPPSVNQYARSRGVRASAGKKLLKLLEPWYVSLNGQNPDCLPPATTPRRVHIHLTYPPGGRRMDHDNVKKVLIDGLKTARLIVNDSPDWLECPEPTDDHGLYAVTTITLTDLEHRATEATDHAGGRWTARCSAPGRVVLGWVDSVENPDDETEPFVMDPNEARTLARLLERAAAEATRRTT